MHVALAVEHLHDAADLDHRLQRRLQGHRPGAHLREQIRDRTVLHDQVGAPIRGGAHAVQLDDRGVPGQQRHRVGLAVQLEGATLVALRAHDLDRHVTAGQLLSVQEYVGETALPQRAHPSETWDLGATHARDRWTHFSPPSCIVRATAALRRSLRRIRSERRDNAWRIRGKKPAFLPTWERRSFTCIHASRARSREAP